MGHPNKYWQIQWRSKPKAQELHFTGYHPWKRTAGTWKYPGWKKEDYGYKPPMVGFQLSVLGGNFKRGLGPFSTFWIAGHSDATCSGMGRLPWGEGDVFLDKKVNSSKKKSRWFFHHPKVVHAILVHQQYNKVILQNHFKYSDLPDVMSTSTIPKSDYHIFALGEFEEICESPQLSAKDVSCSSLKFGKMCHVRSLFLIPSMCHMKAILHNCCFKQIIMYLFDSKHTVTYDMLHINFRHNIFSFEEIRQLH